MRILFSAILLLSELILIGQDVVINEFMSSNFNSYADEDGDYSDWIELYNKGSDTVDLEGYHISDNPANLYRWEFPTYQLEPGGFLIVFASGKDRSEGPHFHTNFSISKPGEPLFLLRADNAIVDSWPATALVGNQSYGRVSDGAFSRCHFSSPSPGTSNDTGTPFHNHSSSLVFSHDQGFYALNFDLFISSPSSEVSIHYTRDGSDPTLSDSILNGPLHISSLNNAPNSISMIPTNVAETWYDRGWKIPEGQVQKAVVIKAQAWQNGAPTSPVYTKTYFVGPAIQERYRGVPVISIVTDSLNLFDYERGIYVPGLQHDARPDIAPEYGHGNYNERGSTWERPAHMSLFENDGSVGLSQNVGVRIHGGMSRIWPIKSLRLYARDVYGSETMDYQFFPDKDTGNFRSLLSRNSGNDFLTTYFTDALSSVLLGDMEVERQSYRPAVVFINGEYWGIHNLRQHMDIHYLYEEKGASPELIDMVENWGYTTAGSGDDFYDLMEYVAENDLSVAAHYHHVTDQIDIRNFIDYYTAKQYIAVKDWPGNNIVAWRSIDTGNKWRWLYYDNDEAFVDASFNSVDHAMYSSDLHVHHTEASVLLFNKLFGNSTFRKLYLRNFAIHLGRTFKHNRVLRHIDSLASNIAPLMDEHIARWGFPSSRPVWEEHVNGMRAFAKERPCQMLSFLQDHFPEYNPSFTRELCPELYKGPADSPTELVSEVTLWPIPANDVLNVSVQQSDRGVSVISIFDITGRRIKEKTYLSDFSSPHSIYTSDLVEGTYILEVKSGDQSTQHKFIVARRP